MMDVDEAEEEVEGVVVEMGGLALDEQQSSDTGAEAEKKPEASTTKGKLMFSLNSGTKNH